MKTYPVSGGRAFFRGLKPLREAGRADACNVNWGNGRSYLESGSGSFYDLSSEAPSAITFRTAFGTDEQREDWSNKISAKVDLLIKSDKLWDYQMQLSQQLSPIRHHL